MDMMKVTAVALMGTVALLIFKQYKPEWGIPTRLVLGVVLAGMLLAGAGEILTFAETLTGEDDSMPQSMWRVMIKGLGIAFVTEIATGVCRDSGEASLATWVEMAGKLALLMLAMPLIRDVLLTVKSLLGVMA